MRPSFRYRVKHYSQCLVWAKNNGTNSGIGERPPNHHTLCHLQAWSESCRANVGEGPCAGRGPAQILHVNNGLLESCWSDNVYASLILLFFIYLIKSDSSCPPPLSIFLIMLLLELRVNYFYPLSLHPSRYYFVFFSETQYLMFCGFARQVQLLGGGRQTDKSCIWGLLVLELKLMTVSLSFEFLI